AIPQVGKKRLRRPSLWNRNIRKVNRTLGRSYTSTTGRKKIGENCNCKSKCFEKIGEGCNLIFLHYFL
ncbi:hypothetical protein PPYR_03879, partial [Photinus pyralis]